MEPVVITALDQEGRGIARIDGKATFVEGALIGERVTPEIFQRRPSYDQARTGTRHSDSPLRVEPLCPHFGVCGGCTMQHLDHAAQVAAKQRVLEDTLWHVGRVKAEQILAPIYGRPWGYRHRARLSVRHVVKKGGVLVGFHERKSSFITDMRTCPVLPLAISALIPKLRELFGGVSIRTRIPQVELAVGEAADESATYGAAKDVIALGLRILEPLSPADEALLDAFAEEHGVTWYVQTAGPETVRRLHGGKEPLKYSLPDFGIEIAFELPDFTQVNADMNRVLVRRTIGLLDPRPAERIADFFCGLGNFSLPIARRGAFVVGVEGNRNVVVRAGLNAAANGLADRARFLAADLFKATPDSVAELGTLDKALLDPPREGAIELVKALPDSIRRVVYVSCNPATLARDAGTLVGHRGYVLRAAGIANMFPQTAHVESIAVFEREG